MNWWVGCPDDRTAEWEPSCPASQESILPHMASPGRDPDSKFPIQFLLSTYCFCIIIKSKKWLGQTILKSRTVCVKYQTSAFPCHSLTWHTPNFFFLFCPQIFLILSHIYSDFCFVISIGIPSLTHHCLDF